MIDARREDREFIGLAVVHDQRQLRCGSQITLPDAGTKACNWNLASTIRLACTQIGQSTTHATRETCHILEGLGAVACAYHTHSSRLVSELVRTLPEKSRFLGIIQGWDSSPRTFEFGSLSDILFPVAKYWHKDDNDRTWSLLNAADLQALGSMRRAQGVLELLAQDVTLIWNELASSQVAHAPQGMMLPRVERFPSCSSIWAQPDESFDHRGRI
jgi:hypothetical protein